jgi:hypothetical protein
MFNFGYFSRYNSVLNIYFLQLCKNKRRAGGLWGFIWSGAWRKLNQKPFEVAESVGSGRKQGGMITFSKMYIRSSRGCAGIQI